MLRDACDDLLAFTGCPVAHWKRSGRPFRLAGAVLVEAHDEWQVSDRRHLSDAFMALHNRPDPVKEVAQPALIASWSPHR